MMLAQAQPHRPSETAVIDMLELKPQGVAKSPNDRVSETTPSVARGGWSARFAVITRIWSSVFRYFVMRSRGAHTSATHNSGAVHTSLRDASIRLRNHDDHRVGAYISTCLEHHLELAAVAALYGQNVGLALLKRRPRRVSLENHQNVSRIAVP
jgi:hypothetical protein